MENPAEKIKLDCDHSVCQDQLVSCLFPAFCLLDLHYIYIYIVFLLITESKSLSYFTIQ